MDYILGGNPLGYSFLLGYGDKWPTHIHHRAAQHLKQGESLVNNPEVKYTNYGTLVGGIDASGNYQDHSDKYQYTEPALDYNGCFALACAGLCRLYGGDESAMAALAKSVSEINESFDFGGEPLIFDETTTTPVTTTTTSETTTTTTVSETTAPFGTLELGNVNCDNRVDVSDAVLLARYKAEDQKALISAQGKLNADVDRNGALNGEDVTLILKYIAKLITF